MKSASYNELSLPVFGTFSPSEAALLVDAGATELFVCVDVQPPDLGVDVPIGVMANVHSTVLHQVDALSKFAAAGHRCAIWSHCVALVDEPTVLEVVSERPDMWIQVNYWEHDEGGFFDIDLITQVSRSWAGFVLALYADLSSPLSEELRLADEHPEWGEFDTEDFDRCLQLSNLLIAGRWDSPAIDVLAARKWGRLAGIGGICVGNLGGAEVLPHAAQSAHDVARWLRRVRQIR